MHFEQAKNKTITRLALRLHRILFHRTFPHALETQISMRLPTLKNICSNLHRGRAKFPEPNFSGQR
jgi:hypothetical protein